MKPAASSFFHFRPPAQNTAGIKKYGGNGFATKV
jgi:hypothetical protein